MKQKDEVLICDCNYVEHQIVFRYDTEYQGGRKVVYINPHLTSFRNFWQRLKYGLKYAFGYQSRYGAFDEILITEENYAPLKKAVNYLES